MGFGGISIWQLLIILAIVVMLFGTKRLRGIGSDLGEAIKGFKKSVSDDDKDGEKHTDPAKVEQKTDGTADSSMQSKQHAENKQD
ncbi:MAG TPA: twin-arginine translocase TatA/TatE family subunit [Cellvibrionaceae bacterium]